MATTFTSLITSSNSEDTKLKAIISRVAREYSLSLADLRSDARFRNHSMARRAAARAAFEAGFIPPQIARCMFKDPASVYSMLRCPDAPPPRLGTFPPADSAPWEIDAREQDKKFVRHMRKIYPDLYCGEMIR